MLKYIARQGMNPNKLPKVYYCSCAADKGKYFDVISTEVLELSNCTIWYKENYKEACDSDALTEMQLVIIPVTYALFSENNEVFEEEYNFFKEKHIAILPIILEPNLEALYEKRFGSIQYLSRISSDITEISYTEKLKKRLEAVLTDDETIKCIQNAFDGYIFISYRKKDRSSAQKLMKLLHENEKLRDYATWYDEFLIPGENYNFLIQEALEKSDFFSLVVTPNVLEDNNYIITHEYPAAVKLEKDILPFEVVATDKTELSEKFENIPQCTTIDDAKNIERAFEKFISQEEKAYDAEHDYLIGLAYLTGTDVEMNKEKGVKLIEEAAHDSIKAREKLVSIYELGDGVAIDFRKAAEYQKNLNDIYRNNYEVNQNEENALRLAQGLLRYARLSEFFVKPKYAIIAYNALIGFLKDYNKISFSSERLTLILNTYTKITELQLERNAFDYDSNQPISYYMDNGHNDNSSVVRRALCKCYIAHGDYQINTYRKNAAFKPDIPLDFRFSEWFLYQITERFHGLMLAGIKESYDKAHSILTGLAKEENDNGLTSEFMNITLKDCEIHYVLGDFSAAEEKAKTVIAVLSDMAFSGESILMADAYEKAGLSCLFQGKHEEALELYSKAFNILYEISEKSKKPLDYRRVYYNAYIFVCIALLCGSDIYKTPLEAAKKIFPVTPDADIREVNIMLKRIEECVNGVDYDINNINYISLLINIFMTIPFRCAEGTKRYEKAQRRYTALKFCVKICLRKQVYYRVRGGEWAQRKLNRIFMCTDCSFKHKFVGL